MPLLHDFAPGCYLRRIFMPAGTFVIGKTHKTEHFNFVLSGKANVMIDGDIKFLEAPDVFISGPGAKKVLYILDDMIWGTLHVTEETDLDELEKHCIFTEDEEKELMLNTTEKEALCHGEQ